MFLFFRCCKSCPLKKEDLDELELLTFLTRDEIIDAHLRYSRLEEAHQPRQARRRSSGAAGGGGGGSARETRLPVDAVVGGTPGLRAAPLGDRICAAFSSERDGRMSFDDYLDMVSVMSDKASPEVGQTKIEKTSFAAKKIMFPDQDPLCLLGV